MKVAALEKEGFQSLTGKKVSPGNREENAFSELLTTLLDHEGHLERTDFKQRRDNEANSGKRSMYMDRIPLVEPGSPEEMHIEKQGLETKLLSFIQDFHHRLERSIFMIDEDGEVSEAEKTDRLEAKEPGEGLKNNHLPKDRERILLALLGAILMPNQREFGEDEPTPKGSSPIQEQSVYVQRTKSALSQSNHLPAGESSKHQGNIIVHENQELLSLRFQLEVGKNEPLPKRGTDPSPVENQQLSDSQTRSAGLSNKDFGTLFLKLVGNQSALDRVWNDSSISQIQNEGSASALNQEMNQIRLISQRLIRELSRLEQETSKLNGKSNQEIVANVKAWQQGHLDPKARLTFILEVFARLIEQKVDGDPTFLDRIRYLKKDLLSDTAELVETNQKSEKRLINQRGNLSVDYFIRNHDMNNMFRTEKNVDILRNQLNQGLLHNQDGIRNRAQDNDGIARKEFVLANGQSVSNGSQFISKSSLDPIAKGERPLTFTRFIENFQFLLQRSHFAKTGLTERLTVRLYPEKLGTIKIQLIKQQGELIAKLVSSTKQTKELLEAHVATLRNAFIQQNIPVQRIQIEHMWQADEFFQPRDGKGENQQEGRNDRREKGKREKHNSVQTSFEQFLVNYEV